MTVEEALTLLKKDALFYESSGGGVTLSGGEPLAQAKFAIALLKALKGEGIHTVVDTSGYAPWEHLAECAAYTDLFLYDIKHLDALSHEELTGLDNTLILTNLRKLARQGADIWLRTPIIPGLNDAPEHLSRIGDLMRELNLREINLLPYHNLGKGKYEKLGLSYDLPLLAEPTEEHMEKLRCILLAKGLNAHIGG
jgi:pyruvate formate lyase activating enzyme